jgi:hypothetical protein
LSEGAPGWDYNNVFVANSANVNTNGYGIWVQKGMGAIVACDNTATNAPLGLTNIMCQK